MIEDKLRLYSLKFNYNDVETLLKDFYITKNFGIAIIARKFDCSELTIREVLKKYKISSIDGAEINFDELAKLRGYKNIKDFFLKNWKITKVEMGKILGVSDLILSKKYDEFFKSVDIKGN